MTKEGMKATTRQVLAWALHTSKLFLTFLKGRVLILTYHRILPPEVLSRESLIQPGMYVRSDTFALQVQFLKEYFQVLSFAELLSLWREKNWDRDKRYCVVTFDDGWRDNFLYAYPILRRYEIPATIFLPTALIGTDQWFWPDKLAYLLEHYFANNAVKEREKQLRSVKDRHSCLNVLREGNGKVEINGMIEAWKSRTQEEIESLLEEMSRVFGVEFPTERALVHWGEVEEMSQHYISFGSHSCTHSIFTTLSPPEVHKEVAESFNTLRDQPINFIPVLAYPNGNYSREIIDQAKAAGYQAAVSTQFGFEEHEPADPFALKRIGIHHDISATLPLFSFHIAGGNHFLAHLL